MKCEGTVSKVDPYYGYFEVDNQFRIHLSLLKSHKRKTKLPSLESKITATNLHKLSTMFVACKATKLYGDFHLDIEPNPLINLIKKRSFGASDIVIIDKIKNMLENNFQLENEMKETVTVSLLESLIELGGTREEKSDKFCANSLLANTDVISISSCKYIEVMTDKFEQFPTWSFGIHTKQSKDTILFGLINVHPKYGLFMFSDAIYKMACIVTNKMMNLNHLENCYIIVKNYKVITEVFKETKVPNLEYLAIDFNDIIIIHSLKNEINSFGAIVPMKKFSYHLKFEVLRKSTVCIGTNENPEINLEVLAQNDAGLENIFLTLPSDYTSIVLHLKEGYMYKLFHNNPLKQVHNFDVPLMGKLKKMELVEPSAYFQELGVAENTPNDKILTLEESKDYIKKNSKLFSFTGVIRNRGFVLNKFCQSQLRTKTYGFSMPGKEVHTIVFSNDCIDDKGLTLYLSDWINKLMPLGLIPQMRVKVTHAQPKSTYIKATFFTSIEILSYEPLMPFHTANLFTNHQYDWGSPFYLSLGNKIPHGVIVWSRVQDIRIVELNMTNNCKDCKHLIEAAGTCTKCGCDGREMNFFLIMYTSDEYGLSRVIVKDPKFLRLVLDLSEKQFSMWMDAFENVGSYYFSVYNRDSSRFDIQSEPNYFKNILTELIIQFNKSLIDAFEVKCRKKYTPPKKLMKYEFPQWFHLDTRKVFR